jgi:hypothetical protein
MMAQKKNESAWTNRNSAAEVSDSPLRQSQLNPARQSVATLSHGAWSHGWSEHDPEEWNISFQSMLQYSICYTVKAFDIFDSIENKPKDQVTRTFKTSPPRDALFNGSHNKR